MHHDYNQKVILSQKFANFENLLLALPIESLSQDFFRTNDYLWESFEKGLKQMY
jgi:hypothetical protein